MVERPTNHLLDRARWARGSVWLMLGNGVGLLLTMVAGIVLARSLGPADFGLYSVTVVAISIGYALVTFRLDMHLVTALRSADDEMTYRRSLLASVILAVGLCSGGVIIAFGFTTAPPVIVLFAVAEVAASPLFLARAVLQVQGRQSALAVAAVGNRVIWLILVVIVVVVSPPSPLPAIFGARLIAALVEVAIVLRASGVRIAPSAPSGLRWPSSELRVLRATSPLALSGLAGLAYNRSDQVLLASMRNRADAGIYAAGVRLADLLLFLGPIVQNVTLPGLVELHRRGDDDGTRRAVRDIVLMTVVPAGLAVAVLAASRGAVAPLLFGAEYESARWPVVILGFGAWLALLGTAVSSVALAADERGVLLIATTAGLAVNIGLNLYFLRRYGAIGAACTSVAAYLVASLLPAIRRSLRASVVAALKASSLSFLAMGVASAIGLLIPQLLPALFAAAFTYVAMIVVAHHDDGRRVLRAVQARWTPRDHLPKAERQ